jgi:hypothetical protein
MQTLFVKSLLESVRLAQEDPTTSTSDSTTSNPDMLPPPEGGPLPPQISPLILYPWLGAHLALGYLGYKAYDNNINGNADLMFEIFEAFAEFMGETLSREDFDKEFFNDEFYDQPTVKGFTRSRLAGFVSAGLSLAGTAATFLAPPNIFQYLTFGSTLASAFVVAQALTAKSWYKDSIDSTDPDYDTLEEVVETDTFFEDSRNYLLFGGLAAFATDAVVLVMMFMGGPADAPAPEALPPTTEDEAATVELSLW